MHKKFITAALATAFVSMPVVANATPAGPDDTVYHPVASQVENTHAMEAFSAKVGVGTTVGALTGTGIGFIIGCAIGGGLTAPTVVFVPVGCLTGGVTGAGIGGVIGTLVVGGPTAVIAGVEMVQVLLTPA
ncbi:hypothetical protein [Nocardia phage P3.1]|nr:hypothetical protein [Nocardia phage P3.1]